MKSFEAIRLSVSIKKLEELGMIGYFGYWLVQDGVG
jgi:hypothetical protein